MRHRHFTFVELLIAIVVAAIVLPIAIRGITVAGQLSSGSERMQLASRLANAKLNELIVTGDWSSDKTEGIFEDHEDYSWALETENLEDDSLPLVRVRIVVTYPAGGRKVDVVLETFAKSVTVEQ